MKLKSSLLLGFILFLSFLGCSKNDDGKCIKCEQSEAIEICDAGDGKVSLVVEGKVQETQPLPDGVTLESIAAQTCASLSIESCFECRGPNVQNFDVCKTEDGVTIDGELIPNSQNATVEQVVQILETNSENEPLFVGLSCQKK